ncbi:hypothetical protein KVR01_013675 [Diaporthe batatas]|uniref:uncharacterized protein n=1 Tax=Diaporthe batatas TaxID=748121 RepID=UPI001D03C6CB|nr:uncharacterized protein KVR01_013675 [Diaporthe batatas]KAG8156441.1 hypothetical protein KVR01_013675 [Diaporthe batatas]
MTSSATLEWFIEQGDAVRWSTQPFAATISGMIETGLHEWGFVIYRCAYGDNEEWKRFMKYFEDDFMRGLETFGGDAVLPQYAKWTVIEDKEALDNASIDTVRAKFVEWRDTHNVARQQHWVKKVMPLPTDAPNRLPRFTYCIYVDQKCLNTLPAFAENFPPAHRYAPVPPLVVALIDGDYDESLYVRGGPRAAPDEEGQYPEVDGHTCKYVGWQYVQVKYLSTHYDKLDSRLLDGPEYRRPPKIAPLGYDAVTENGVLKNA